MRTGAAARAVGPDGDHPGDRTALEVDNPDGARVVDPPRRPQASCDRLRRVIHPAATGPDVGHEQEAAVVAEAEPCG